MAQPQGFWYSVGQLIGGISALSETAATSASPSDRRRRPGPGYRSQRPFHERPRAGSPAEVRGRRAGGPRPAEPEEGPEDSLEWLLARGAMSFLADRSERWLWRRRPGPVRFLRAAAAGAGAAVAATVVGRVLDGFPGGEVAPEEDETGEIADELVAGAGRGLVYASVVEPLVPGPPSFRGALYGTAEYLAGPWGGLTFHLGAVAPQRRIPILRDLLEPGRLRDASYLEYLAEGIVLGVLYGPSSPGGRRGQDRRGEEPED